MIHAFTHSVSTYCWHELSACLILAVSRSAWKLPSALLKLCTLKVPDIDNRDNAEINDLQLVCYTRECIAGALTVRWRVRIGQLSCSMFLPSAVAYQGQPRNLTSFERYYVPRLIRCRIRTAFGLVACAAVTRCCCIWLCCGLIPN